MKEYFPLNWYWKVGGDETKVYSSKAGDYVPVDNADYVVWASDGTTPTGIDTEANLGEVLAPYYPDVPRPAAAAVLDGYQANQSKDVFRHKVVKLLFVLINRIQVLEGKPPLTVQQARNYVKGLM